MEKEDRLLVTDYSDNLEMVEKVLKSIDRPRPAGAHHGFAVRHQPARHRAAGHQLE